MKIGITGEKGLIGSFLKQRLEKEGNEIVLTCDLRDGKNILDLKNYTSTEKIDAMYHLAAHCKINQSISNPEYTHLVNSEGTFAVIEFCRKNNIPKVVNFSSSRVLSSERNPYTASKLYGEELCKGYRDSYGLEYLIIRPSTVYGPMWDETKRLMHLFCVNALEDKPLEIYGNPKTKTLDFTYVDDFVDAIILATNNEWNKEYNISGGKEYNIYSLAEQIIRKTESKSKIIVKQPEIAQPQEVSVDISAIEKLGFIPKISLEEGVDRTLDFYKKYLGKN
ncbi:MAG TPA: NAD(P)-dependent oxidoreductase [Nanoarchaeota archaeon]|nr:NAD(P)-dependent oxidoreductase [Nanoarchaeota archaeon]HIH63894.1 NAD(P)-dependent oxidoreductase [Nanoarchaeota archaeon]HIJ09793.1 NAD(P)-dependent oxidoreductase [Nanoarchaeota archaeon]